MAVSFITENSSGTVNRAGAGVQFHLIVFPPLISAAPCEVYVPISCHLHLARPGVHVDWQGSRNV